MPARADEYAYHRTLDRSAPASGATALDVTGYNGDVSLVADGGDTVRVRAVLKGRSTDAVNALDVGVSRQGNAVRVQDVCPSQRRLFFWTFADCDIELEVHYPRALALTLQSQNGDIDVQSPAGSVSITNGNGDVTITGATTDINLSNGNGDVTAKLAKNWRGREIRMHGSAGDVELYVPSDFAARYNMKVMLGEVSNNAKRQSGPVSVIMSARFGNFDVLPE
ncbi:MAG TPA: DUF4097 family beta strand repeat-containing protein [Candidatus Baltobacteraceae bacterium]|nr:DUF4097 family beta strand repeat-containing protein [Candidatus Baltobacteraceae bacterium]